jgi:uncharacterized membrane protein
MHLVVITLLIGIVAGLRAGMPLATVSWAARLGLLPLGNTPLAFLGYLATPYIFSVLELFELYIDKRPNTPSRLNPGGFIARIVTGAFAGAAIGLGSGSWLLGMLFGGVGAVLGTLGGAAARVKLAKAFGKDLPAALIEDAVAVIGSYLIVTHIL